MTSCNFTLALFCGVDDVLKDQKKHALAELHPSEVVTLGMLQALRGEGNRDAGQIASFEVAPANVHDTTFHPMIEQWKEKMIVLADKGFKAKQDNPSNLKICPKGPLPQRAFAPKGICPKGSGTSA